MTTPKVNSGYRKLKRVEKMVDNEEWKRNEMKTNKDNAPSYTRKKEDAEKWSSKKNLKSSVPAPWLPVDDSWRAVGVLG